MVRKADFRLSLKSVSSRRPPFASERFVGGVLADDEA